MGDSNNAYPPIEDIALNCGMSHITVQKFTMELEDKRIIKIHRRHKITYSEDTISIQATWESVYGKIEHILNISGGITISKKEFISEWNETLLVILKGLKKFYNMHSFHEDIEKLEGMLVKINESCNLYRDTI